MAIVSSGRGNLIVAVDSNFGEWASDSGLGGGSDASSLVCRAGLDGPVHGADTIDETSVSVCENVVKVGVINAEPSKGWTE